MNKIIFFTDWKKMYQHPTPHCKPFMQCWFNEKEQHEDADAYVQINIQHPGVVKEPFREPFYDYIKKTGKPSIVFESAVFRQNVNDNFFQKYFRFSWNSFLWDEGNFGPMGNGPDRWNRIQKEHDIEIKPCRETKGEYILIVLQHVIDTSLVRMIEHFGSYFNWLLYTVSLVRYHTDMPIVIRPHPKHGAYTEFFDAHKVPEIFDMFPNIYWSKNQGSEALNGGRFLQKDLDDAQAVVGWTSNSLTEAACYGIPTYSLSKGAMVSPLSRKPFSQIEEITKMPDRQQWLNDLSYCQWTYDEVISGQAWNHIKNADLS